MISVLFNLLEDCFAVGVDLLVLIFPGL